MKTFNMEIFVGLVVLILTLAVIGFLVWLITTKVAMTDTFKMLIELVAVVVIVIYALGLLLGKFQLPTFPFVRL